MKKDKKIKARDTMSNISNKDAISNKDDKKSEKIKSEIDTKRKRKKRKLELENCFLLKNQDQKERKT